MTPLDAILLAYRAGFHSGIHGWASDNVWCRIDWSTHPAARHSAYAFWHGYNAGEKHHRVALALTSLTHSG